MSNHLRPVWFAATGLLLAACGGSFGVGSGTPEEYIGQWELTQGSIDGEPLSVPDGSQVTLRIEEERLGGTSACNSYGGEHDITRTSFSVGEVAATAMGCAQDLMDVEQRYLDGLAEAERIERDGDQLVISGPNVTFRYAPDADELG